MPYIHRSEGFKSRRTISPGRSLPHQDKMQQKVCLFRPEASEGSRTALLKCGRAPDIMQSVRLAVRWTLPENRPGAHSGLHRLSYMHICAKQKCKYVQISANNCTKVKCVKDSQDCTDRPAWNKERTAEEKKRTKRTDKDRRGQERTVRHRFCLLQKVRMNGPRGP